MQHVISFRFHRGDEGFCILRPGFDLQKTVVVAQQHRSRQPSHANLANYPKKNLAIFDFAIRIKTAGVKYLRLYVSSLFLKMSGTFYHSPHW